MYQIIAAMLFGTLITQAQTPAPKINFRVAKDTTSLEKSIIQEGESSTNIENPPCYAGLIEIANGALVIHEVHYKETHFFDSLKSVANGCNSCHGFDRLSSRMEWHLAREKKGEKFVYKYKIWASDYDTGSKREIHKTRILSKKLSCYCFFDEKQMNYIFRAGQTNCFALNYDGPDPFFYLILPEIKSLARKGNKKQRRALHFLLEKEWQERMRE